MVHAYWPGLSCSLCSSSSSSGSEVLAPWLLYHPSLSLGTGLPAAAQAVPRLPEVLPLTGVCSAGLLVSENNPPLLISMNNDREASEASESHDQLPFLRGQVLHYSSPGGLR